MGTPKKATPMSETPNWALNLGFLGGAFGPSDFGVGGNVLGTFRLVNLSDQAPEFSLNPLKSDIPPYTSSP